MQAPVKNVDDPFITLFIIAGVSSTMSDDSDDSDECDDCPSPSLLSLRGDETPGPSPFSSPELFGDSTKALESCTSFSIEGSL